jgi:hypothetical protein
MESEPTFSEVGVDAAADDVRLRRMPGVLCAGRIVNPKTARSQLIGGKTRVFVDSVVDAFKRDRLAERFAGSLG